MLLYFDFEGKRRKAEVLWPDRGDTIAVTITDAELLKKLPSDFLFDVVDEDKVSFVVESADNKRLTQLQNTLCKRLQELVK